MACFEQVLGGARQNLTTQWEATNCVLLARDLQRRPRGGGGLSFSWKSQLASSCVSPNG